MRQIATTYSFDKVAKTITLPEVTPVERVLLIVDQTNETIIYDPSSAGKGGTISGFVLTLDFDTNTGSFNNSDTLQIFYDNGISPATETGNLKELIESLNVVALQLGEFLDRFDVHGDGQGNMRVNVMGGTTSVTGSLSTVTTVSTATNLVNLASINADLLIRNQTIDHELFFRQTVAVS